MLSRVAIPAPSLPSLPVPVPVRVLDHAAPNAAPRATGCQASPILAPSLSRPGPRSPYARYLPPTRYMLAAMAVPAAASGRTKGSGRLTGAGLEAKPGARGWCFTEVSVGPAQPAPPPPQPSRFIPARAVAAASTASSPGRRGRRRPARLLPEGARLPPDRIQAAAPPALAEPRQTLDSEGRREGLPCPPRGSPPSGTPSADPQNKAQRSAPVGELDLKARLLPEEVRLPPANRGPALGYFRCGSAPPPRAGRGVGLNSFLAPECCSSACGRQRLEAPFALLGVICKRLCPLFA